MRLGRSLKLVWRRVRPMISLVLLILVLVVPLVLFAWLVFYTDVFHIQAVTVVDARETTISEVRNLVEEELSNNLATRASNSLFFVRPEVIESRILTELPYVRSVHVRRQLPGTLKVIIQEKTPAVLLLADSQYYFIDVNGLVYEKARLEALPGLIVPTVKNRGVDNAIEIGTPVLGEAFVGFVREVDEELPKVIDADVVEVVIPALAAREVQFQLSNNWKVRFDVTRSAEGQLKLLRDLVGNTISAEEKSVLDYVDLRIPNRIYYKTRFVVAPSASSEQSDEQ